MDKDLIAFKTWLKNLGLEINDGTDDEALKKWVQFSLYFCRLIPLL